MSVSLAERSMLEALVAELHRAMAELPGRRERRPEAHAEDREECRPDPRRPASSWLPRLVPIAEK
jgi:hypothetical protein